MNFHPCPKDKALRDRIYLNWLRTQPCIVTGLRARPDNSVVPMHIGTRGKGLKSPDDECLPILASLHSQGHQSGEISMLRKHLPDDVLRDALRAYARELYRHYQEGL